MVAITNIGGALQCSMPQSLAGARCWWSAVQQQRCQNTRAQDLNAKWILHMAKFRNEQEPPKK